MLTVNDHWLKGSGLVPGWLTGKLSDITGLFFFPLLVTAIARTVLSAFARRRLPLRPWHLASAIALTTIGFVLLKTAPAFARWFEEASPWLDPLGVVQHVRVTPDLTDLLVLPVFFGTWWHGRRFFGEPARPTALDRAS